MKTAAILDTNIFDLLVLDRATVAKIESMIAKGAMEIIVTRTIAEELWRSPFKGVPPLFPVVFTGNTVGRIDVLTCIDAIGDGETFDAHLGGTNRINDALIADAADHMAKWLVTEDKRLRTQMQRVALRCKAVSYVEFLSELDALSRNS
jgi:rRNA-processing protein FCF1